MPDHGAPDTATDVTALLDRWRTGDRQALDLASDAVYPELRRIADAYLKRERRDHTLQPTALVHEAFLRLTTAGRLHFDSRKQFYALAAQLMRRILVDHARTVRAQKRGGGAVKVPLDDLGTYHPELADQFLILHDALDRLATFDARKAQVIELRYFGGLTLDETAEYLDVSPATVHREQRLAQAWLSDALGDPPA